MQAQYYWHLLISGTIVISCFLLAAFQFQTGSVSPLFLKVKSSLATSPAVSPEDQPNATLSDGGGNFSALRELCAETQWMSGLWLHCHSFCGPNKTDMCGGLNNARNRISTCIRYAIDAGASVIIPSVTTRSESNLQDTDGEAQCPSVFWDIEHLQSEMENYCPQLNLSFCDDRPDIIDVVEAPNRGFWYAPYHKGSFADFIGGIMTEHGITRESLLDNPVVLTFADPYVGWSYSQSDELFTIRKELYRILPFNENLLSISREILARPQLQNGHFIGVHLRAEKDWPAIAGSGANQMRLYKQEIELLRNDERSEMKTVYVSCGDRDAIEEFRQMLLPLNYTVHDKWTLLADDEDLLVLMDGLPFDQKAIVEYGTLVQSEFFLGLAMSSMSSLIAYARTVDDENDLFMTYIFPGSTLDETRGRTYPVTPIMLGDERTKLMMVNGFDMMDNFP